MTLPASVYSTISVTANTWSSVASLRIACLCLIDGGLAIKFRNSQLRSILSVLMSSGEATEIER